LSVVYELVYYNVMTYFGSLKPRNTAAAAAGPLIRRYLVRNQA